MATATLLACMIYWRKAGAAVQGGKSYSALGDYFRSIRAWRGASKTATAHKFARESGFTLVSLLTPREVS